MHLRSLAYFTKLEKGVCQKNILKHSKSRSENRYVLDLALKLGYHDGTIIIRDCCMCVPWMISRSKSQVQKSGGNDSSSASQLS